MKRLVWLTSYPKSGNTWVRIVLAGCSMPDETVNLNDIPLPISSCRHILDSCLGIETEYLTRNELLRLLPAAYAAWALDDVLSPLIKNHEMFLRLGDGAPIFPPEFSRGVVHIVRDPRDVAVSFAAHLGASIDGAIERMGNPAFYMLPASVARLQIVQKLSSWSCHAESWINAPIPRLQVRYEDMLQDPFPVFQQITKFCGIQVKDGQLLKVIQQHTFKKLQESEARSGFDERPMNAATPFFRQGQAAAWKQTLSLPQVRSIEASHGPMMQRLGYELTLN